MRESSFRRPAVMLGLLFFLVLGAGGGVAWLLAARGLRGPLRILLVTQPPPGTTNLDPATCRAIGALVQDHLESFGQAAVTSVTELPGNLDVLRDQRRSLVVQLEPSRQEGALVLSYRYASGDSLDKGAPPPWIQRQGSPLVPAAAFEAFLAGFPKALRAPAASPLVPRQPDSFWDMIGASARRLRNEQLDEAFALAERAAAKEPSCATLWVLLGNLRYRRMLNNPAAFRQEQSETEIVLLRGLSLEPYHPRGVFLLSLLKADGGNQAEALTLLLEARRRQPHNPTLLTGIAYAARGAGLLPLARQAMDLRDRLAFASLQPQAVDITYLYTGEIQRFEAGLRDQPGHLRSTSGVLPFYRGYLALVRGDQATAQREFKAAATLANGYPNILRLSQIYDLILEGRKDEAWTKLREYDQERIGMREPDGEFTLRLAEAYALIGDRASAMDMAGRAFARGFGCTEWYERSPMLEPLRGLPKWKALMQHLRERQSLMEERFPVGLLEDN
ncbi:tetratricopeptide repeat protein [Geothrix fermentans]|jgi:hypothetical protein|uniref:tetratricopeptide repeat protein n=1 Tax=Geothrix fermentans TaxID=44676 RepID=UPI00040528AC|nr:hypothetical protein [Geothrix fermentans]